MSTDEPTVARVGETVERQDYGKGVVRFRCTVCNKIYEPSRRIGGDDPAGVLAAENAFECHPDGALEKEPAPGDRVLDTGTGFGREATVIGRPDENCARAVFVEEAMRYSAGIGDGVSLHLIPVERLRVLENNSGERGDAI